MRARDNPFSTDRVLRIRYQPQGVTWEALLARLATLRFRAAIAGPHGSGKTTLLEELGARIPALGFTPRPVRLDESSTRKDKLSLLEFAADLNPNDLLILDGAEQLNLAEWWRFRWVSRRVGGLLISVHRPSRLPILWRCATSVELLGGIIGELSPKDAGQPEFLGELFLKHRGNVREALRELYDRHSELEPGGFSETDPS